MEKWHGLMLNLISSSWMCNGQNPELERSGKGARGCEGEEKGFTHDVEVAVLGMVTLGVNLQMMEHA